MAAKGWGTRLLLLTPYTSLPDVGAMAFPAFPVRLLMRDRFDSLGRAASIRVPTLVVHGTRDEVVPFVLGQQLAAAIAGAELFAVEGAGHNTVWDSPGVLERVGRFVTAR
jgi:pimeloyl-ACP methyl ester carboxylesterase